VINLTAQGGAQSQTRAIVEELFGLSGQAEFTKHCLRLGSILIIADGRDDDDPLETEFEVRWGLGEGLRGQDGERQRGDKS
jgi:hypothetical protein